MEKRKALGKGLQALIPDIKAGVKTAVSESSESISYLTVSDIRPGRYQPRLAFNQRKLQELVASIKEKGVVQPILVRRADAGYELIAGERRLKAVKTLGVKKIPAIIREVDDIAALELGLVENIQREDLNPLEEAKAYKRLCDEFDFTQERIAVAVGRDRTSVTNMLRLLNLPPAVQKFILDELLSMGHARALLSVATPRRQMRICERIIKKGLSVRETEQLVRPHIPHKKTRISSTTDPQTKAVEDELQQILGTRVRIQHGKKRGKVVVEYYSPADLDRIIGIIKG